VVTYHSLLFLWVGFGASLKVRRAQPGAQAGLAQKRASPLASTLGVSMNIQKYFLLFIFGIVINIPAVASAIVEIEVENKAKDTLKKECPNNSNPSPYISFGDINNDSFIDFVALCEDRAGNDLQIVIFLGERNKSFKFFQASGSTLRHERVVQFVEIKNKSIFLNRDGCCEPWKERFQFKAINNEIVLIGFEYVESSVGDNPVASGRSVNLLTSEKVYWQKNGKKRTESKVNIPSSPPIKFDKFNYDEFTTNGPKGVY